MMRQKKSKKEKEEAVLRIREAGRPKTEVKIKSANQLNLRARHYLLRADVNDKQQIRFRDNIDGCFSQDYDIATKNLAFQKIRECDGVRLSERTRKLRQQEERAFSQTYMQSGSELPGHSHI